MRPVTVIPHVSSEIVYFNGMFFIVLKRIDHES